MSNKKSSTGNKNKQQPKAGAQNVQKPKPAQQAAHKPQPAKKPEHQIPQGVVITPPPGAARSAPLFSPLNIAIIAASLFLIGAGATVFARIQFSNASLSYTNGCALFTLGVILPCLGVSNIRNFLFPSTTIDQYNIGKPEQGEKK